MTSYSSPSMKFWWFTGDRRAIPLLLQPAAKLPSVMEACPPPEQWQCCAALGQAQISRGLESRAGEGAWLAAEQCLQVEARAWAEPAGTTLTHRKGLHCPSMGWGTGESPTAWPSWLVFILARKPQIISYSKLKNSPFLVIVSLLLRSFQILFPPSNILQLCPPDFSCTSVSLLTSSESDLTHWAPRQMLRTWKPDKFTKHYWFWEWFWPALFKFILGQKGHSRATWNSACEVRDIRI